MYTLWKPGWIPWSLAIILPLTSRLYFMLIQISPLSLLCMEDPGPHSPYTSNNFPHVACSSIVNGGKRCFCNTGNLTPIYSHIPQWAPPTSHTATMSETMSLVSKTYKFFFLTLVLFLLVLYQEDNKDFKKYTTEAYILNSTIISVTTINRLIPPPW